MPVLDSLIAVADSNGKIAFERYGDLARLINYPGSANALQREVESLYLPVASRKIIFLSRSIRRRDPQKHGDTSKHLIIVPTATREERQKQQPYFVV